MTALIFALLGVFLAASIPIFVSLALVAILIFFFYSAIPMEILPQRMFAGVEGFALLAIPFFILAADLMGRGGVTSRLVRFVNTLVGHFPGGLAICAVMTCLLFGAITGSSASTVIAVGGILYPALIKSGYDPRFTLGVVTCSALLGMIIPPSNAMIVYGSVSKVSVGALFMAGFGAGLVFALNYAIYCYAYARWKKIPLQPRASRKEILTAGRDALWGLGIPFIILGGIYSGVFTPTESAAVAVAYAMFVTRFVYRELSFGDIWSISLDSATITARVLIMVSAATLFSWLLTVQGVTSAIVEPVIAMNPPPWAVLGFANLSMLVAGMFVDVFSNILILSPLLLRLLEPAGISELHFGIVATVNSDMGNITPPFGLNLFIASGAFKKSYVEVVRAIAPWLAIAMVSLMIITYVPEISLWLPKQLYPGIK
jgi:C4-dicarboxylate transporter, DctM subunit